MVLGGTPMKKRILSLLIALCLTLAFIVPASADSGLVGSWRGESYGETYEFAFNSKGEFYMLIYEEDDPLYWGVFVLEGTYTVSGNILTMTPTWQVWYDDEEYDVDPISSYEYNDYFPPFTFSISGNSLTIIEEGHYDLDDALVLTKSQPSGLWAFNLASSFNGKVPEPDTTPDPEPSPTPTPTPEPSPTPTPAAENQSRAQFMSQNPIVVELPNLGNRAAYPSNNEGVLTQKIIRNTDGSVLQLDAGESSFTARLNDAQGTRVFTKEIQYELPMFGAFFVGKDYNFAAFGQHNPDQSSSAEVYRIVKYDKNWNRLDSLSLYGTQNDFDPTNAGNTTGPFSAATPRFAENGNTLILHTGRTMYTSSRDGLRHQAALYVFIDISTMRTISGNAPWVSHSFNQFPLFDGASPVFLDHGDAYPRTITLWRDGVRASMLNIPGRIGDNWTGVSVGGFEMSSRNFISTVNITRNFDTNNNNHRDIYALVLPRNFTADSTAAQTRIATYFGTNKSASTPKMVKVGSDLFGVFWQEFEWTNNSPVFLGFVLQYIDGDGQLNGQRVDYSSLNRLLSELLMYEHFHYPAPNLDTAAAWAHEGINAAFNKGFIPADIQDNYTAVITREEFCRMAVRWVEYALGMSIDEILAERGLSRFPNPFADTSDLDILAAYALGITAGTSPTTFDPKGLFTRQQAATMIMNTCKVIGAGTEYIPLSDFTDMDDAAAWARPGINFVRANGIMSGTNTIVAVFSPNATYTRQESIVTFNNIDPTTWF